MVEDSYRPLGRFELAQVLTSEVAPLNAVTVLRLASPPPPEALKLALAALRERYPLLRARIVEREGEPGFEVSAEVPVLPLELRPHGGAEEARDLVEEELATPFDAQRGPLLRCRLLNAADGTAELIVSFHHAIMDAASGIRVVEDLLTLWAEPADGPPSSALPSPTETLYPRALRGRGLGWRAARYLARQVADEARYRLTTRAGPPIDPRARNRILSFTLDGDLTHALSRRARRERLTLHSALAAALLRATSRHLYGEKERLLRHLFFADLRPYLEPPPTPEVLAAHLSLIRVTVASSPRHDFWAFTSLVERAIRNGLQKGGKFLSPYLAPTMIRLLRTQKRRRMATTALAYHGRQEPGREDGPIPVLEHHTYVSNVPFGPRYTAQVRLSQKRLVWDVVFLDQDFDRPGATAVAKEIRRVLAAAA